MRIAVIGAGIFGSTVAVRLAQAGFVVDLFEKESDILQAASGINQYRLHRGYHYPRSLDTARSSKKFHPVFENEYGDAVIKKNKHYYVIAKELSKISGQDFLKFCKECGLEHTHAVLPHVYEHMVDVVIEGIESLMDPSKLRDIVKDRIKKSGVHLFLNYTCTVDDISEYDIVVNATYANLNFLLEKYPEARREYQFELCEKPVLKLGEEFNGISIVVMDGPFMCIDPLGDTGFHVMGNVVHAIHRTNTGMFPEVPEEFKTLLNRGIVKNPHITNIEKFFDSAIQFMPGIKNAEHIGSMYTVRTVLPRVDHSDERPTLVYRVNDKIINVFSGKIGNCVEAADEVLRIVSEEK